MLRIDLFGDIENNRWGKVELEVVQLAEGTSRAQDPLY